MSVSRLAGVVALVTPLLFSAQPSSAADRNCRLVEVDTISLDRTSGGRPSLYIAGMKTFANMDVHLEHRGLRSGAVSIAVVGCTPSFIPLPIATPYWVDLPLADIRARHVEIVAANGTWRRRLPAN